MAIITIEGFKVYSNLDGSRSVIINSDRIEECMHFYVKNKLDGVAITISHDYKLQNIDFLSHYPDIENLSISEGIDDISAIHKLNKLKSLILSGKNKKLDFSCFPHLKNLIADWSKHFINLDKCFDLTRLSLYNFNTPTKNCTSISGLKGIKKLEITQSTIQNLNGLKNFFQLEELKLSYCNKLSEISSLEKSKTTLVSIELNHCKNIRNYNYLSQLELLKKMSLSSSASIPSLKFIEKIGTLEFFTFVNTDVTDGNMLPCVGLKYVGFSNKKHFSHTMKEIQELSKSM